MTHDYKRHGTTTLFAALIVSDGLVIEACMQQHRHQEWIKFLQKIDVSTDPQLDLHLVADNYATHKHPQVKRWLAKRPRFHMHFTPTSSSWLNLVERWFREITQKRLRCATSAALRIAMKKRTSALVRAIRYVMLDGALDRQLLKHLASRLPDSQVRDRIIASVKERPSVEAYARTFGSSGYVVDSVPLALIAAVACDNLLGGIEQLVRCGGDTDTIASMFGQLYGAAYGQASLPIEMVDRIDAAPLLRPVARDLAQFIDRRRP
jgi:transposase